VASEKYLTRRWNNWLALAMGIPFLVFGIAFLSGDIMTDLSGFITILVAGAVY
jgi:hypothetical protein